MRVIYIFFFTFCLLRYTVSQTIPKTTKPDWVIDSYPQNLENRIEDKESDGYVFFLHDIQINISKQTEYKHFAYKIFNLKGVENASKLYVNYNPSYQKINLHSLVVNRNGKLIDKTKSSIISNLQREASLEDNIYNGYRTLSIIIDDIKPGDIVEYSYSIVGYNPILKNKFYYSFYLNGNEDINYIRYRIIKPKNRTLNINYLNQIVNPDIVDEGSNEIFTWELKDVAGYKSEPDLPSFYDVYNLVELSEYNNWNEVIKWAKLVFSLNSNQNNLLDNKIEEFKKINNPEAQIVKAIQFVQDEIRYFGVEIGENSHKPKMPDEVMKTGFGDCKDKSLLLVYILNKLNINAEPVLVSTYKGIFFHKYIPSPQQFNHAIVKVELNGFNKFIDPTISFQGGDLRTIYTPNYYSALVINDTLTDLVNVPVTRNSQVKLFEKYKINSVSGTAELLVKTFYKGYEADVIRYKFNNSNISKIAEDYKNYYASIYDTVIQNKDLKYQDNRAENIFTTIENYQIPDIWQDKENNKFITSFSGSFVKELLDLIYTKDKNRNYPLALPFPNFREHYIEVELPEKWDIKFSEHKVENKYLSYYRKVTFVNQILKISYKLKIKELFVQSSDFISFKNDVQEIYDDLNYQIFWNEEVNKKVGDSNINWLLMFVAFLLFIIIGALFILLYFKISPKTESINNVPQRIGGWLMLPFIGLFLNIVIISITLFTNNFFNKTFWILRTEQGSDTYIEGFSALLIFELAINIFFICFSTFLIISFIKHFKYVPKFMIIFYVSYFVLVVTDHVLASILIDPSNLYYLSKDIIRSMISCIIWIPYFMMSERVKDTFVS